MSFRIPIKAKVYRATDSQTAIKVFANVSIGGFMHINSYTVSNTLANPDKLSVFPPSYKFGSIYRPHIEFASPKKNALVKAIEKACTSAYEIYASTGEFQRYGETFMVNLDKLPGVAEEASKIAENTSFGSSTKYPDEIPDEMDIEQALKEAGF